jgi:hypothetical protein
MEVFSRGDGDEERVHAIVAAGSAKQRPGEATVYERNRDIFDPPLPCEHALLRGRAALSVEFGDGMGRDEQDALTSDRLEQSGYVSVIIGRRDEDASVE